MFKLFVVASVCIAVVLGADDEPTAETLKFESDNHPDGTYEFSYETSNGIVGQSSGTGGVSETGERSWVAPDGTPIKFSYVANEGGFQPVGDHIPQAPPHIARLIEWLEAHPSDDDGSYKPQPAPQ